MNRPFITWNRHLDLEVKFAACALLLVAAGATGHLLLEEQRAGLVVSIASFAALCALAVGFAHYTLFKPIRQLAVMAQAVRSGDFRSRLRFRRRDELGSLALELDNLCDQLDTAKLAAEAHLVALDQLRHSDRIATLGRLASSVAHELGNPLSVIELRAQLITSSDVLPLSQAHQNAVVIVEQSHRMARILDEILSFARMQPPKICRVDVVNVLRKAIALSEHTSRKHKTGIELAFARLEMEIDGDADKLLQVVVNLVVNGLQATPNGGTLRVSASDELRAPIDDPTGRFRDYVRIDVVDHGVGIPAAIIPRVFEPFFTTRNTEGGTGLGLSVAQGIAREHEGWISVESELGSGSSFQVYLPLRAPNDDSHAH